MFECKRCDTCSGTYNSSMRQISQSNRVSGKATLPRFRKCIDAEVAIESTSLCIPATMALKAPTNSRRAFGCKGPPIVSPTAPLAPQHAARPKLPQCRTVSLDTSKHLLAAAALSVLAKRRQLSCACAPAPAVQSSAAPDVKTLKMDVAGKEVRNLPFRSLPRFEAMLHTDLLLAPQKLTDGVSNSLLVAFSSR